MGEEERERTLVVVTTTSGIQGRPLPSKSIETFEGFIQQMVTSIRRRPTESPRYWIAVNCTGMSSFDFNMTKEERLQLFKEGEAAAAGWMEFRQ